MHVPSVAAFVFYRSSSRQFNLLPSTISEGTEIDPFVSPVPSWCHVSARLLTCGGRAERNPMFVLALERKLLPFA